MPDYSLYNDQQLLSAIAEDDRPAFDEIYKRFWKTLFAIAYRHLNDVAGSEDIVHDVFISLWQNRQVVEARELNSYLASAAKYLVLRRIRRAELLRRYQQQFSESASPGEADQLLQYKELLDSIRQEVEKLPEKCRLSFQYRWDMDMSGQEIARTMDVSPHTVKNQLAKALKQIRSGLKDSLQSFFFW